MLSTKSKSLTEWQPTAAAPWNLRRVWHLHRRAGFGATWEQLQRDFADGPEVSIDRMVAQLQTERAADDFAQMSKVICDAAVASNNINRLKAWWLYRMLNSPNPLRERLTMMWHNHFATSNVKVEHVGMMRQQNDTLRRLATGNFGELLRAMANDPALLVWLDADANRKEHPNENLAREIMEVFALGEGNYSEQDIKEAARALTGWTVKQAEFRNVSERHDGDQKTIFGETGNWSGDDFVRMLLEHPATPRRLAFRICETFMGESNADEEMIDDLAAGLAEHELNLGWAVETVIRSEAFFADANIGNRVRSPVDFIVGAIRSLEIVKPLPSTLLLAEVTANLGQDLFNPPNVFGWPGGRSWLTSRGIIARANFASALVNGQLHPIPIVFDAVGFSQNHGNNDPREATELFAQLLLGVDDGADELNNIANDQNNLIVAMLSSPQAFLG
ncbi:MAG: DUF1800 domain-containing protein [Planctomycetaceae bacterium]